MNNAHGLRLFGIPIKYVKTKDAYELIQKKISDEEKAPHRVSFPVLRRIENEYVLSVFVFFFDASNVRHGLIKRPSQWAIADIESGRIISKFQCKENDFSDASFDVAYQASLGTIGMPIGDYYLNAFALLDIVRSELIKSGKLCKGIYDVYKKMILSYSTKDLQKFYLDLSKTDEIIINAKYIERIEKHKDEMTQYKNAYKKMYMETMQTENVYRRDILKALIADQFIKIIEQLRKKISLDDIGAVLDYCYDATAEWDVEFEKEIKLRQM